MMKAYIKTTDRMVPEIKAIGKMTQDNTSQKSFRHEGASHEYTGHKDTRHESNREKDTRKLDTRQEGTRLEDTKLSLFYAQWELHGHISVSSNSNMSRTGLVFISYMYEI